MKPVFFIGELISFTFINIYYRMKVLFLLCCLLATNFCQAQKVKKAPPDYAQIKNTINAFYKWYNTNWKKTNSFKIYKSKQGTEGPPYVIDWKEAERYFNHLRKNVSYLSEAFIQNEKQGFKNSEEDFKKYPEDELPSGFDYDHFTNTQEEPAYFLQELMKKDNQWKFNAGTAGTIIVTIISNDGAVFFCGQMKKEKGVWKIADTQCDKDDNVISNQ